MLLFLRSQNIFNFENWMTNEHFRVLKVILVAKCCTVAKSIQWLMGENAQLKHTNDISIQFSDIQLRQEVVG